MGFSFQYSFPFFIRLLDLSAVQNLQYNTVVFQSVIIQRHLAYIIKKKKNERKEKKVKEDQPVYMDSYLLFFLCAEGIE